MSEMYFELKKKQKTNGYVKFCSHVTGSTYTWIIFQAYLKDNIYTCKTLKRILKIQLKSKLQIFVKCVKF